MKKVCIDAGHGMSNKRAGVFDSGCERGNTREADIVLSYAQKLAVELRRIGVDVWMTREDWMKEVPVGLRARNAEKAGCEIFVSIHVNDADGNPTGTETLWRRESSLGLANGCQQALLKAFGLRDRGIKFRDDLAVLKFKGVAVLLELGFIGSDMGAIMDETRANEAVKALAVEIKDEAEWG